ncbi:MAG: TIGR03842 family LLM class F420-dependent oxidoreductase [Candidatus Dormibacteria bacterium]
MQIGVVLQTDPPARRTVELARRAEAAGCSHVWTFDSVVLWQEPFVIYPQILAATERVLVGPMVTNPLTRDPTVTASIFATLNEAFGARTVCGIGRGDSAVRFIGNRPASLSQLEEAITLIKGLAEGREVLLRGKPVRLSWAGPGHLEVMMAAYGPKALAVAGRCADGLILQLGDPAIVAWAIGQARAAAAAAGRDPGQLRICVAAPAYVGADLGHQREQVRWFGGMVGNHVAEIVRRYGDASEVPRALTDYVKQRTEYDYRHHGRPGNPSSDFVPDEVVDRFCLLGPAEAHLDRLLELAELGVDQFAIYLMHDGQEATLKAYAGHLIGAVADV